MKRQILYLVLLILLMCGLSLCQYDENEDGGESDEESEYPSEDQEEARDIRFRL